MVFIGHVGQSLLTYSQDNGGDPVGGGGGVHEFLPVAYNWRNMCINMNYSYPGSGFSGENGPRRQNIAKKRQR